jgi:hypothetical protein
MTTQPPSDASPAAIANPRDSVEDVVVRTDKMEKTLQSQPSARSLGGLSTMTRNSEGYGTHVRSKKKLLIAAERKMAPRFLLGVFLTIFM